MCCPNIVPFLYIFSHIHSRNLHFSHLNFCKSGPHPVLYFLYFFCKSGLHPVLFFSSLFLLQFTFQSFTFLQIRPSSCVLFFSISSANQALVLCFIFFRFSVIYIPTIYISVLFSFLCIWVYVHPFIYSNTPFYLAVDYGRGATCLASPCTMLRA